jgi:predicted lipoprotein
MPKPLTRPRAVTDKGFIPEKVLIDLWAAYYLDYVKKQGVFSSPNKEPKGHNKRRKEEPI